MSKLRNEIKRQLKITIKDRKSIKESSKDQISSSLLWFGSIMTMS